MGEKIRDLTGEIDCVFFDFDGVLIDFCDTGIPNWLIQMVQKEARAMGVDDISPGNVVSLFGRPGADHFRQTCTELGIDRPSDFWDAVHHRGTKEKVHRFEAGEITAYDDISVIQALSASFKIAIVSNQPQASVEQLLHKLPVHDHVDGVVGLEGLETNDHRKPNPDFILDAKRRLGVESPAYVGDSAVDVEAARTADAVPVYINRDGSFPNHQAYNIQTLGSLRALLE
ncbi:HAD family hydrolase [Halocatena marina]|uniref:HAD family hydrolase n=1 Tax=Halocatena marina TaxID=2934937 RepID=UPI00200D5D06|nr:HAD-IA family hydrolase [Halocatena marina]